MRATAVTNTDANLLTWILVTITTVNKSIQTNPYPFGIANIELYLGIHEEMLVSPGLNKMVYRI